MIKKTILVFLAISTLISLTSCCLKHDWQEATCTSPKTCAKCGKIEGYALEHNYSKATCTTPETCLDCGLTRGMALEHDFAPATYEKPATCERCGATTGEKLTPVREWGFYNLEEMGNALVQIEGYSTGGNNPHVIARKAFSVFKFENGYKTYWKHDLVDGKFIFSTTSDPDSYSIVNNDCLDINNGWEEFDIDERKTSSTKEDFVVFVESHGMSSLRTESWLIPYSLIDWDKKVEVTEVPSGEGYKLFLK